jgi:hypothetical protein
MAANPRAAAFTGLGHAYSHLVEPSFTGRSRPGTVRIAVILQVLIGLAFLSIPIVGLMYATDVQAAVEAEVVRQGYAAAVLAQNNIRFDESGAAVLIPVVVALVMATVALLNLVGRRTGLVLSWILQPIVLLGNIAIVASQTAVVQTLESIFERSGDVALRSLDVRALLDAAESAYPVWLPLMVDVRNVVVMLGSVLVVVLLAMPSARAYFRSRSS